jgi:TonB family protein
MERWRSALENYVPSVTPSNQVSLTAVAVPFASYLVQIHNRIHPIFADAFLASLERLPPSDPLNQPELYTSIEIAIDKDGRIGRLGVTRSSTVLPFDIAVLDSVTRAQPFGQPPHEILSADGNVYIHWDFYRGVEQCGTANCHPFILSAPISARTELLDQRVP